MDENDKYWENYRITLAYWISRLQGGYNPVDGSKLIGYHPDMHSFLCK